MTLPHGRANKEVWPPRSLRINIIPSTFMLGAFCVQVVKKALPQLKGPSDVKGHGGYGLHPQGHHSNGLQDGIQQEWGRGTFTKKNSYPSVHFQKSSLKFIEKLQFYSISFGNIFNVVDLAYASYSVHQLGKRYTTLDGYWYTVHIGLLILNKYWVLPYLDARCAEKCLVGDLVGGWGV